MSICICMHHVLISFVVSIEKHRVLYSLFFNIDIPILLFPFCCYHRGYPGVYARVSEAYDWIQQEVCRLSSNDSTITIPEYFNCPTVEDATTFSTEATFTPTASPRVRSSMAPSSIQDMTMIPTVTVSRSPSSSPTMVPTTNQSPLTDVPSSSPSDESTSDGTVDPSLRSSSVVVGSGVIIESPTVAPTTLTTTNVVGSGVNIQSPTVTPTASKLMTTSVPSEMEPV